MTKDVFFMFVLDPRRSASLCKRICWSHKWPPIPTPNRVDMSWWQNQLSNTSKILSGAGGFEWWSARTIPWPTPHRVKVLLNLVRQPYYDLCSSILPYPVLILLYHIRFHPIISHCIYFIELYSAIFDSMLWSSTISYHILFDPNLS